MEHTPISFSSEHFTLTQLSNGIFAAIAADGGAAISNAGILDLGDRTVVFDTFMTPQAARDLRRAAQSLTGREPELVINSHYHNDHIWGNQVFSPQAVLISTSRTRQLLQTAGQEELKWAHEVSAARLADARRQYDSAADEHQRREAQNWIGYFGGLVEALPSLEIRLPDMAFEDRLTVHGSAHSFELIPFENCHTGSDAILLLRELGIVFMADLLFVKCHPYLDEADVSTLRSTLQELMGIGATIFVPGHGPLGSLADVASNIDYVDMCTAAARNLVSAGDISYGRIAGEAAPAQFAGWGLSRFFTANLESLCSKMTSGPALS